MSKGHRVLPLRDLRRALRRDDPPTPLTFDEKLSLSPRARAVHAAVRDPRWIEDGPDELLRELVAEYEQHLQLELFDVGKGARHAARSRKRPSSFGVSWPKGRNLRTIYSRPPMPKASAPAR